MVFEDYYPFLDPALKAENGNLDRAFSANEALSWGVIVKDDPLAEYNHIDSSDTNKPRCNFKKDTHRAQPSNWNGIPLTPLPPCEDPTGWAAKALAMEYKWRGVNKHTWIDTVRYEHTVREQLRKWPDTHSMYEELKNLDPSKFNTSCIPRPGHFVAMVPISKTVSSRACHGEGCTFKNAWDQNAPETSEVFSEYLINSNDAFNTNSDCTPLNRHSFLNYPQPGGGSPSKKFYNSHCCRECANGENAEHCNHCNNGDIDMGCCTTTDANYVPTTLKDAIKNGMVSRWRAKRCCCDDC